MSGAHHIKPMIRMMMISHEADDMPMISRCKAVILSTNSNLNLKDSSRIRLRSSRRITF